MTPDDLLPPSSTPERSAVFGDFRFERRDGLCGLQESRGLRFAASAGAPGSGCGGVDTLGINGVSAPADASEHRMRFRFRSRGLFAVEPSAHLALGLAGDWQKADPSSSAFTGRVVGRGIIIGNVSGAQFGCPRAPVVQLESFHRSGNRLVEGSGSDILQERRWYHLEISATLAGVMHYRLEDDSRQLVSEATDNDAGADVSPALGGWWITHVFSDQHPKQDWGFDIAGLTVGWY